MLRFINIAVMSVALSACSVTPPSVRVAPAVEIKAAPGVVISGTNGHCPPGQAKKGRC